MSENPVHSRLRRLVDRPSRAQESLDPGNVVVRWFFPTQCLRVGADWQLTGVGCSAMIVVDITYISEMFPAKQRGTYQGRTMSIGLLGIPATA